MKPNKKIEKKQKKISGQFKLSILKLSPFEIIQRFGFPFFT